MIRSQKGLTLVELMISVGFLTLVLLGAFYVLMVAHQMSEEARGRLLAANAARSVLEVIKNTPIQSVPGINPATFVPADLPNGQVVIQTNPPAGAGVQIATVTVTVNWTGPANRPLQLQVSTMRSRF